VGYEQKVIKEHDWGDPPARAELLRGWVAMVRQDLDASFFRHASDTYVRTL
jgi:hypothetical protein